MLEAGTGPLLLLSAGIGVTPVLCDAAPARGLTTAAVNCGGSTPPGEPEERALAAESDALLASLPRAQERLFYTHPAPDRVLGPDVATGRLSAERLADLHLPSKATTAYVCGPTSFMDDMREALTSIGLASERIRTELFGARDAINPGIVASSAAPPHPPPGPPGAGPLVTFARSSLAVRFGTGAKTILELAEACDVPTAGVAVPAFATPASRPCSTAMSPTETPLDPPAPEEVLICSAQPETDVVLDL